MSRSVLGRRGEDAAVRYLEARGWRIVDRNFRRREGEIDIVAERKDVLAFVEVKTRMGFAFGTPGEAVTYHKQARIRTLARRFLLESGLHAPVVRFDVVEVVPRGGRARIAHIEGAF